ncbi:protein phosphatase methylesterase 1 [Nilaparvata lugens]|uniref:protein phosphatase methylesterase 1 n=1 Tax=Nilaparvata lugens TaxID=108931 RepID=UPI00193DCA5E|nr:protein phosphatase methylesterase 1 [Nilaparvata lugens]
MSSLQKGMFTSKLPPRSMLQDNGSNLTKRSRGPPTDFTPTTWDQYFSERSDVKVGDNQFRLYKVGSSGPLLLLLHGGGCSALSWALFAKIIVELAECQVVAMDLRGHGDSITTDDEDLSIETMTKDVVDVVLAAFPDVSSMVVMGHSMGGAVAVHVAHAQKLQQAMVGVVVIDVVEGTAVSALASMQCFLRSRPQAFQSLSDAVRWSLQSGQLKNAESAKVSMPGQIKNLKTNKTGVQELDCSKEKGVEREGEETFLTAEKDTILEEEVTEDGPQVQKNFKVPTSAKNYGWRVELRRSERFWPGWFAGLSKLFLSAHAQKLLLLANLDRLDTDLTVGQMQGKFEMHAFETVAGRVGHSVHEDVPDNVARVVATFLTRNKFAQSKGDFHGQMPCC